MSLTVKPLEYAPVRFSSAISQPLRQDDPLGMQRPPLERAEFHNYSTQPNGFFRLIWWFLTERLPLQVPEPHLSDYRIQDPVLASKVKDVFFRSHGLNLHAWYIPPEKDKEVILFVHGNAGSIASTSRNSYRQRLYRYWSDAGYGVFAYDPPGYGKSSGKPSEKGRRDALKAASGYLNHFENIPLRRQIAMGESLGGSDVIEVATQIPFRAIIPFSTFPSATDAVRSIRKKHFAWVPPIEYLYRRWLLFDRYNAAQHLPQVKSPVLMAHLDNDGLLDYTRMRTLFDETAPTQLPRRFLTVPGTHHTALPDLGMPQLLQAMQTLLQQSEGCSRRVHRK